MFAVVEIGGQQFKVAEKTKYYVPRLKSKVDSEVTFDTVLVLSDGKKIKVGNPSVKGAKVQAKVLEHLKDEKVIKRKPGTDSSSRELKLQRLLKENYYGS